MIFSNDFKNNVMFAISIKFVFLEIDIKFILYAISRERMKM